MATYNSYAKNFYSIQQRVKKWLMKNNLVIIQRHRMSCIVLLLVVRKMYLIRVYYSTYIFIK